MEGTSGVSGDKVILLQQNMAEAKKRLRVKNSQLKEKDMIIAKLAQRLRNPQAALDEDAKDKDGEPSETKEEEKKKAAAKLAEKKEAEKKELPKIVSIELLLIQNPS